MKCPICRIPLIVVEREGIEIDWCLECRGLWFDEGELELLGEKAGRRLEAEELGRRVGAGRGKRKCPRCRRRMERLLLGSGTSEEVEVDRCDAHGLWLDRGELGRIIHGGRPRQESDEGVMLQFLGETFDIRTTSARDGAHAGAPPIEGRER